MASNLARDIRYAFRVVRNNAALSLVIIVLLSLGIGANSAIFSFVNAVLLQPLPYRDPEGVALFWETVPQAGHIPTSEGGYLDWKERSPFLESLAAFRNDRTTLMEDGRAERIRSLRITANTLPLLGVSPLRGRNFTPQEDQPGAAPAVLLSYSFWQSRMGGDPAAIGKALLLDNQPHQIAGVLPEGFIFPPPLYIFGKVIEFDADLYLPLVCNPEDRDNRGTFVVGRLGPGLTFPQAEARLKGIAQELIKDFPDSNPEGMGAALLPLQEQATRQSRARLLILQGAVLLILLIACFNVANLLLAKSSGRRREIALRSALGAERRHIVRQLLAESLLLALAGGLGGLLIAAFSLNLLVGVSAGHIHLLKAVSIDAAVMAFTLAAALATGILFGLVPALQAGKLDLTQALREGSRESSSNLSKRKARSLMVVAEVAAAVILIVIAGLLLKSLLRLQEVDLGFRPEDILTLQVDLPDEEYAGPDQKISFLNSALSQLRSLPGAEEAGAINHLPLTESREMVYLEIQGRPVTTPEEDESRVTASRIASEGYFKSLQIPLLQGRLFSSQDRQGSPPVYLIDQALAERHWPGKSPLGALITTGDTDDPKVQWGEVVGVVGSIRHFGPDDDSQGALYVPYAQAPSRLIQIVLRTSGSPEAYTEASRRRIQELDAELPLRIRTLDSYLYAAQSARRSPTILLGGFAMLALMLAVVGLYSVLSYLVGQRTQEFGVRMALGASKRDIVTLVGRQTAWLVLTGVAFGLACALLAARFLSALLYEVSPDDPVIFTAAALAFTAVAGLASCLPAWRASKVNPSRALRSE